MSYVCFIIDAFSRMIVGWRVAAHMRTQMALDAIEKENETMRTKAVEAAAVTVAMLVAGCGHSGDPAEEVTPSPGVVELPSGPDGTDPGGQTSPDPSASGDPNDPADPNSPGTERCAQPGEVDAPSPLGVRVHELADNVRGDR
jgi:hypothetical protein